MTNFLKKFIEDKSIPQEVKTQIINEAFETYRSQQDQQYQDYRNRQILGGALEIGSALPVGGIGAQGAKLGAKALTKYFGKNISKGIGSGLFSGAVGGGIWVAGDGIANNQNPITSAIDNAVTGAVSGGILGGGLSSLEKFSKGNNLRKYNINNHMQINEMQDLRKLGKDYYNDYLNGRVVKDSFGHTINFPNSQAGEISLHNYNMIPELPKQLKTAQNFEFVNDKPNRTDAFNFGKLTNNYDNKNYEYLFRNNSNKSGNDFYQIKNVGSNPAYSQQNRALKLEPDNILIDNTNFFNPLKKNGDLFSFPAPKDSNCAQAGSFGQAIANNVMLQGKT